MKIVSFKIAKALKETGYPQGYMGQDWCYENGQYPDESECDSSPPFTGYLLLPAYLEVWLWLCDKLHYIDGREILSISIHKNRNKWNVSFNCVEVDYEFIQDTQEEAIIAAIEYLVDNNLIK